MNINEVMRLVDNPQIKIEEFVDIWDAVITNT
jgi:hypothetical protein